MNLLSALEKEPQRIPLQKFKDPSPIGISGRFAPDCRKGRISRQGPESEITAV